MGNDDSASWVRVTAITKNYGPELRALDGVSLSLAEGEIHGLLGTNGAGKSTLIKILTGIETADDGTVELAWIGEVQWAGPSDAAEAGIAVVHQELPLFDNLSAADNTFFQGQRPGIFRHYSVRRTTEEYARASRRLAQVPDAKAKLSALRIDQWQQIAILRTLVAQPKVLILDEPTSALSSDQKLAFHQLLRQLSGQGLTILYVTHFLDDAISVCDRISVLRDGRISDTVDPARTTIHELLELMTGQPVSEEEAPRPIPPVRDDVGLEIRALTSDSVGPVDLDCPRGELVGLYGLPGHGADEFLRMLFGIQKSTGTASWLGRALPRSPRRRSIAGLAYVSGNRSQTLVPDFTVLENICLAQYPRQPLLRQASRRWRQQLADEASESVSLVGSTQQPLGTLSGGNQQRVAFGRWNSSRPTCYLADDPTRGVDARGRSRIHEALRSAADRGDSALVYSSDPRELEELCDRVVIFKRGAVHAELHGAEINVSAMESLTRTHTTNRSARSTAKR